MDWQSDYDQLRREIASYSEELAVKPHCIVFTKMDLMGEEYLPPIEAPGSFGSYAVSGAARTGIDELLDAWWRQLLSMHKTAEGRGEHAELP